MDSPLTSSLPCQQHSKHFPKVQLTHRHHVWPLGLGGPDIEDNIVIICPTGHTNVHRLIDEYKAMNGNVPYSVIRRFAWSERRLAKLGWDRYKRGAMEES